MNLTIKDVTPLGVFSSDVFSTEYSAKRRIYINEQIDGSLATELCAAINHLASINHDDITLVFIDCPGGAVSAGLAVIDTMNACGCDIRTVAHGTVASMAAVLVCAGKKGKRFVGENAEIMIHQTLGALSGQTVDILRGANHFKQVNERVLTILSKRTGKPLEQLRLDCDRDYYLHGQEAVNYGLVDSIFKGWE